MNKRFLVGGVERTVRNGRLNCNNSNNMAKIDTSGNENGTYVKRIKKGNETFPYASVQWQKKIIKDFVASRGLKNSKIRLNGKSAATEGNPYNNFDEDMMGFMNACSEVLTIEEYNNTEDVGKTGFKKSGKEYKKNVTKKRRAKLQMSPLQSIGNTVISTEFSVRNVPGNDSVLYTKEVYSSEMSSGFIMDLTEVGKFVVSDNEKAYRDFTHEEVKVLGVDVVDGEVNLNTEDKLKRIDLTLDGIYHMNTNVTASNNLEDLTANFIILADYSIGNAIFNNIFKDGRLDIDLLKERMAGMEEYRLSKIFIGCIDNLELGDYDKENVRQRLEIEFAEDENIEISNVKDAIENYKEHLRKALA